MQDARPSSRGSSDRPRRRIRERAQTALESFPLVFFLGALGLWMLALIGLTVFVVGTTAVGGPSTVASLHAYHRAATCTDGRTHDCLEEVPATVAKKSATLGDGSDSYYVWVQAGPDHPRLEVDQKVYDAVGPGLPVTLIRYEGHLTDLDYAGNRYHFSNGGVFGALFCGLLTAWVIALAVLALLRRFTAGPVRLGFGGVAGLAATALVITALLSPVVEAVPSLYYVSWVAGLVLAIPFLRAGTRASRTSPSA